MLTNKRPELATEWSMENISSWEDDFFSGREIELPLTEHEEGTCDHCDFLRELIHECMEEI
jgi:hypothetical protein